MKRFLTGRLRYLVIAAVLLFCASGFAISVGFQQNNVDAAPKGATERLVERDANGSVRITYFSQVARTPVGANTPMAGTTWCAEPGTTYTKFVAQVVLSGTLSGTNPTLAVKWQHSYDGGTNWIDVGTWTTINATVTPASQVQTVSDVAGSTAVAYGDCWRSTLTFGGTSPGGNVSVEGYAKP